MTVSEAWVRRFKALDDQCPWPGPRPFTADDVERYALVARDNDVQDFLADLLEHSLMVLHGDSGVGKSSLLNVGLLRALSDRGYTMLVCNQWGDDFSGDVAALLRDKLTSELHEAPPPGADLVEWLDEEFGDRAVVVFDQFEEMIRYEPELFDAVTEWVLKANTTSRLRVVLSLRSEYVHELTRISNRARPFSMSQFRLRSFEHKEQIEDVVRAANTTNRARAAVDPVVVSLLGSAWDAVPASRPERGLLFVQAVLYALYREAVLREPGQESVQVTPEDISTLLESEGLTMPKDGAGWSAESGIGLLAAGLRGAVQAKLNLCVAAVEEPTIASAMAGGTAAGVRGYIRRAVRSLSSGGYKLVREQWDLAGEMLRRELDALRGRVDDVDVAAERLFREMVQNPAYLDWQDVGAPDDGRLPRPWETDPRETTSGLMLGLDPVLALQEELRRVVFALQWLDTSAITRTSAVRGNARTSLIHDGFGPALEQWSDPPEETAKAVLARLLATSGEVLDWRGLSVLDGGGDTMAHHVNLRWLNCQVLVDVEHAVFVNCDFRGSRFLACRFEGVVFLNCLMDNVTFEECTVVGPVPQPSESDIASARKRQNDPSLPSFTVEVASEVVKDLAYFRGTENPTSKLVSITSGLPALPWREVHNLVDWEPRGGGVSMVGGRLSSVLVRNCDFEADGVFAIRHTAGSSLDVVEQTHGKFVIFDSSVRGFSVSAPIGTALGPSEGITIVVTESALADTWFHEGLRGRADLTGCSVWQLVNSSNTSVRPTSEDDSSPNDGDEEVLATFEVRLADCGYLGLFNVTSADGRQLEGYAEDGIGSKAIEALREKTRPMIYRSTPARYELELREGKS